MDLRIQGSGVATQRQALRRGDRHVAMTTTAPPAARRDTVVVLSGLLLAMFISALDQTIMATALPTISGDLGRLSIQAVPDRIRALSATVQHGVAVSVSNALHTWSSPRPSSPR